MIAAAAGRRAGPAGRHAQRHDLTPGAGIDFAALANVLLWALALYVLASVFGWLQAYVLNGVVQRTVFRLRERDRGEDQPAAAALLRHGAARRAAQPGDQRRRQHLPEPAAVLSQAVTSLLTVVGVLVMMFIISPPLALIALVTIPLTLVITALIAKRSQKLFVAQWKHTGELNGQIEETYTGHALVKVFGRQREVEERFRQKNEELYQASFGAQFISGLIMPAMTFIGNLVYVGIAVVGGLQVASGTMQLGDVQAFIQYSRQFTQPLAQLGSMANLLQSGVASAERVFELLDAEEQAPGSGPLPGAGRRAGAAGVRGRVVLLLAGQAADRGPVAGGRAGADRRDRRPDRCGQDHAGEPDDALLRARRRADHARRRGRRRDDPATSCARGWAWCCRTRGCSAAPSATTSPTAGPTHGGGDPGGGAGDVRGPVRARPCPRATTPCSTTRAPTSRPGRSSC